MSSYIPLLRWPLEPPGSSEKPPLCHHIIMSHRHRACHSINVWPRVVAEGQIVLLAPHAASRPTPSPSGRSHYYVMAWVLELATLPGGAARWKRRRLLCTGVRVADNPVSVKSIASLAHHPFIGAASSGSSQPSRGWQHHQPDP